ncbi:class I SAM-dependent methyltransferase [Streptomyces sp. NPDC048516]|uniref:class I SAM-dependent methyltransferase n=1 Tax=Streptomyces sp. NPDC048516 TaxID=3365565 RepID=UPI00371093AF
MTESERTESEAPAGWQAGPVREPRGRGRLFDAAVRAYLERYPEATVVALGEGLGTGFWRLDNGRLTWLTVVPPKTAAARRMLLPDGARRRTVARAVTDHAWLDAVREPWRGVVVTAPGVLMRLPPPAVRALLAACAERFPGGVLVFDALPGRAAALARRAAAAGGRWPAPRWGLERAQLPRVACLHPGIVAVREVGPEPAVPGGAAAGGLWSRLVWRGRRAPVVRALTPLVCEVRFASATSPRAVPPGALRQR